MDVYLKKNEEIYEIWWEDEFSPRPVGPVDVSARFGDVKRIELLRLLYGDDSSIRAVLLHALDLFRLHVRPANLLSPLIKVQAVRNANVLANDHFPMRAVHVGSFDFGILSIPIGPEYVAIFLLNKKDRERQIK